MRITDEKVLVKKCSEKSAGLIYIPEIGQKVGQSLVEVLQVGPGIYNPYLDKVIPLELKVGDRGFVNNAVLASINIRVDGKELENKVYLIPASQIKVVLDEGESI